jgi:hypothetical protein
MLGTTAALAVIALAGSFPPTPIGREPGFHLPAATPSVLSGATVVGLRCGSPRERFGVHLEVFARGLVVVVPSGIGVAAPLVRDGAFVRPRGCSYPVRTLAPTGVIEVARGRALRLGDLFDVWGQPLAPTRLAGFTTPSGRPVRAYVGGRRWTRSVREIPLLPHAQIVLQLGRFVPPHPTFLFPAGL